MAVVGGEAGFYAVLGRRQTDSDGVMGLGGAVCSQLDDDLAANTERPGSRQYGCCADLPDWLCKVRTAK
jgi:hypothetical protein